MEEEKVVVEDRQGERSNHINGDDDADDEDNGDDDDENDGDDDGNDDDYNDAVHSVFIVVYRAPT